MGEVGRFHTFSNFYCMRLASRRTLMGAVNKAKGGAQVPILSCPHSLLSLELFLHLSVLAGVGHTHINHGQERRNCKERGRGDQEGTTQILLPTFATFLPIGHFQLSSCFCRHSY